MTNVNQQKINEAVMKAVGKEAPDLSRLQKKAEKEKKAQERYMKGMMTRQEVQDYMAPFFNQMQELQTNLQLVYIQNLALHKLAKENWGLTDEQLDKLARDVADEFYKVPEYPEPTNTESPKEDVNEEAGN